jgi:hypothetical protein
VPHGRYTLGQEVIYSMAIQDRWLKHSPMTDPKGMITSIVELRADVGSLCAAVQGVLIHGELMDVYGLAETGSFSRETLPLAIRLGRILEKDSSPLSVQRTPSARSVGTCRDFALMLCGFLRVKGVAARVRCGFGAYLRGGPWSDHWICEYWSSHESRWIRVDSQIDELQRRYYSKVAFDTLDIPADWFMTANEAWQACRQGRIDPSSFGHGVATGQWFVRVNVYRDHLSVNNSETSAWDSWRKSTIADQWMSETDLEAVDRLADFPEVGPASCVGPPWLKAEVTG